MSELDNKPWYRHFWPWFVIALLSMAVSASLYTVSLAYRTTDSLVVEAPDGMDVVAEQHLAAESHARALGLDAIVSIDLDTGAVTAVISSDASTEFPPVLELEFSHPTNASQDREIALAAAMPDADGNPVWAGHLVSLPSGRHYVVLTPESAADWRLNGVWSGQPSVRLQPANGDEPT